MGETVENVLALLAACCKVIGMFFVFPNQLGSEMLTVFLHMQSANSGAGSDSIIWIFK